jgi:hypothetical protein
MALASENDDRSILLLSAGISYSRVGDRRVPLVCAALAHVDNVEKKVSVKGVLLIDGSEPMKIDQAYCSVTSFKKLIIS